MENDIFVTYINNIINVNPKLLFIIMYNIIPAVIFAPLLIYKGIQYEDMFLIVIGLCLFIVDSMHTFRALNNFNKN